MIRIRPCCPRLRWIVAGLSLRRLGFHPRSVYVIFVVDIAALLQVPPPEVIRGSFVNKIPPMHQTHSFITDAVQTQQLTASLNRSKRSDVTLPHVVMKQSGTAERLLKKFVCSSLTEYDNTESLWLKPTVAAGTCH